MSEFSWVVPGRRVAKLDPDTVARVAVFSAGKKLGLRVTLMQPALDAMRWTDDDRFVLGYAADFSKVVIRKVQEGEDGYKLSAARAGKNGLALQVSAPAGMEKAHSRVIKDDNVDGDREKNMLVIDTPWLTKAG